MHKELKTCVCFLFVCCVFLPSIANTMSFPHNCNKTACDHQSTDEDPAEWSLFCKIDTANLTCLNETSEGSCKKIFRAWEDRLSKEHVTTTYLTFILLTRIIILTYFFNLFYVFLYLVCRKRSRSGTVV